MLLHFPTVLPFLIARAVAQDLNFTIFNGQIFTPGFAVLDAPQPGTPLGGDNLNVALDVTANGKLPLPDELSGDSPSRIFNITMFLYSYDLQKNFTISNGTAVPNPILSSDNKTLGDIMQQEPGSTVKHVNWIWPDCLVGDGQPNGGGDDDNARGNYNISIRQNFRLNGEDHYTIFDVPISVTNSISDKFGRPTCDEVSNPMMSPDEVGAAAANKVGVLFAPGDATQVEVKGADGDGDGLGGESPEGEADDGLGSAGSVMSWRSGIRHLCLLGAVLAVVL